MLRRVTSTFALKRLESEVFCLASVTGRCRLGLGLCVGLVCTRLATLGVRPMRTFVLMPALLSGNRAAAYVLTGSDITNWCLPVPFSGEFISANRLTADKEERGCYCLVRETSPTRTVISSSLPPRW